MREEQREWKDGWERGVFESSKQEWEGVSKAPPAKRDAEGL